MQVSSQKYKMKDGFRTDTTQWVIRGQADLTRLGKGVIEFCQGMKIYEVEEYVRDGAKVLKGKPCNFDVRSLVVCICMRQPHFKAICPPRDSK